MELETVSSIPDKLDIKLIIIVQLALTGYIKL
jgi:hypothetical protein